MADYEERDPLAGAAEEVADRHHLTGLLGKSVPLPAWAHLEEMKTWLRQARQAAAKADKRAGAAAEWLLDNDYQIQRAILQIREDLPKSSTRNFRRSPGTGSVALACISLPMPCCRLLTCRSR